MTTQQKHNLAISSIRLINSIKNDKLLVNDNEMELDMSSFILEYEMLGESYEVPYDSRNDYFGTSCCFAGFISLTLEMNKEYSNYEQMTENEITKDDFYFLFSYSWPNDPIQCAKRALWLLNELQIDSSFDYKELYYDELETKDLIFALSKSLMQPCTI